MGQGALDAGGYEIEYSWQRDSDYVRCRAFIAWRWHYADMMLEGDK